MADIGIFSSTYSCTTEKWSTPVLISIIPEPEGSGSGSDEIIDTPTPGGIGLNWVVSDGTAILQMPCPGNCSECAIPAPPASEEGIPSCNHCSAKFKKRYDCATGTWVVISAGTICVPGPATTSSEGEWGPSDEGPCIWEMVVNTGQVCDTSCPAFPWNAAPAGPFIVPDGCCPENPGDGLNSSTQCVPCVGDCHFLGCSVVGFNGTIGWGTQESSVTIDLVEVQCDIDGTGNPNEVFLGTNLIGYPVYFNCGNFFFGGLLQNWTYTTNSGGRTYNVRVIDPRQILENCVLITDTYSGPPIRSVNYFDIYSFYEQDVYLNKDCADFGNAEVTERGMPYTKIMNGLKSMNPTICTPVGANLYIDWSTFDVAVPEYFRIAGPSITILQLISDICDEAGFDFFVTLEPGNIIRIYPVSLKRYDPIEDNLIFGFQNANIIDFSYGKELRISKTRNLLFGEQQHYLDIIYGTDSGGKFEFFFGETAQDSNTGFSQPIVPYKRQYGQFWIKVDARKLNASMIIPLPVDSINLCEYDIRTAMHSADSFQAWTEDVNTVSELGKYIQATYLVGREATAQIEGVNNSAVNITNGIGDALIPANSDTAQSSLLSWPPIADELAKIHEWVAEFGRTFYAKQFLIKLDEKICVRNHPENFGEKMYTDTPTNDGGWVDPGIPVLGLNDPELEFFRTDDGRVEAIALFTASGVCGSGSYSGAGGGAYSYTVDNGEEFPAEEDIPTLDLESLNGKDPDGKPCNTHPNSDLYLPGCS